MDEKHPNREKQTDRQVNPIAAAVPDQSIERSVLTVDGNPVTSETVMLNLIRLICESRHAGRLVVLGEDESLTDNQVFDRLIDGGTLKVFEVSSTFLGWANRLYSQADAFTKGKISEEEFESLVNDAVQNWTSGVFTWFMQELDFGERQKNHIAEIFLTMAHLSDDLHGYDWPLRIRALRRLCSARWSCFDLIPSKRSALQRIFAWTLEKEFYWEGTNLSFYPCEIIVAAREITFENDDWALFFGVEYSLVRPPTDLRTAWEALDDLRLWTKNRPETAQWHQLLDKTTSVIESLKPIFSDESIKKIEALHRELEITVKGTRVGNLHYDFNDDSQRQARQEISALYGGVLVSLKIAIETMYGP
ncbi:MAG TPA: hypothetical protein PKD64_01710 [Pirellulaceae bacterium]|nr:hypothetical protein [Pirellulaceae bacterium]HMO90886.1 hypothetical protein [Pirellulaceae bacterium]HMP68638.1 hypothetical protein [Pirellulaceae bacterium]